MTANSPKKSKTSLPSLHRTSSEILRRLFGLRQLELFALAFVLIFVFGIAFALKIRGLERNNYRFYNSIGKSQVTTYEKIKDIFDRDNFPPRHEEANPVHREERVQPEPQELEVESSKPENGLLSEPEEIDFFGRRKPLEF